MSSDMEQKMQDRYSQSEPDFDAEMKLPDGKSCADCRHINRCESFGVASKIDTSCDYHPSKFWEQPQ